MTLWASQSLRSRLSNDSVSLSKTLKRSRGWKNDEVNESSDLMSESDRIVFLIVVHTFPFLLNIMVSLRSFAQSSTVFSTTIELNQWKGLGLSFLLQRDAYSFVLPQDAVASPSRAGCFPHKLRRDTKLVCRNVCLISKAVGESPS